MAKNIDWLSIESEYIAGEKSVNAIAIEHGVSEGSIRAKAKKNGWIRSAVKTKREIVSNAMAGIAKGVANVNIRNLIDAQAEQDIQDMQDSLSVARACIRKLYGLVAVYDDPKEIKTIVDANKAAMETIRRIRGLDDESKEPPSDSIQVVIKRAKREND